MPLFLYLERTVPPFENTVSSNFLLAAFGLFSAHFGHQLPPLTMLPGEAAHSCPLLHRKRTFVLLLAYSESIVPPFAATAASSLARALSVLVPSHTGHHPWPAETLPGVASNLCPSLHSTATLLHADTYSEIAVPPLCPTALRNLSRARALDSCILRLRQCGHHVPRLTLLGVASHSCPRPHLTVTFADAEEYGVRTVPPLFLTASRNLACAASWAFCLA